MPSSQDRDDLLLEHLASTFNILDEMMADEALDSVAWTLATGATDDMGRKRWRPVRVQTDPAAFAPVHAGLPAKFPPLYERLPPTHCWADGDLRTLYAHGQSTRGRSFRIPPARLGRRSSLERPHQGRLSALRKSPDVDYDPVCFDIRSRNKARDHAVVKIAHEEILRNSRIKIVKKTRRPLRGSATPNHRNRKCDD